VSIWKPSSVREWTFSDKLITGYGNGIGEYGSSYAVNGEVGVMLNGRVSASLKLIRSRGVGAGLVCRADENWNFVAFYTAPESLESDATFLRFGVYREGALTNIATSEDAVTLGKGYNRFSLEFFSGQLRGEVKTESGTHELAATCVEMPFPGYAGIVRLYGAGLMVTDLVVQQTTIPLTEAPVKQPDEAEPKFDFDVFLCHAGADKQTVREISAIFASHGITYWLDEEQIVYGDRITEKIEDGLNRSRYTVPCISSNLAKSGWARAEYGAILNAELTGDASQVVVPLVLDDSGSESVPLFLRDKSRAYYENKTEFARFLQFLRQRPAPAAS
jgi:TIR domain